MDIEIERDLMEMDRLSSDTSQLTASGEPIETKPFREVVVASLGVQI